MKRIKLRLEQHKNEKLVNILTIDKCGQKQHICNEKASKLNLWSPSIPLAVHANLFQSAELEHHGYNSTK
uniref:Uncharacterized protein n=1 Tax=Arundo donax TaxID=35708 RepID=A0A0A9EPN9_ARUDO